MTDQRERWLKARIDWPRPVIVLDPRDVHAEALSDGVSARPTGGVNYSFVGPAGGPAFPDPLRLCTVRSPSGFEIWYGTTRLGEGSKRTGVIGPGTLEVRAEHDYYDTVTRSDVVVPPEGATGLPGVYRFDLVSLVDPPRGSGRIEVRGVLRRGDGSPIEGWPVRVNDWGRETKSKADGCWVLRPADRFAGDKQEVDVGFDAFETFASTTVQVEIRPGVPLSLEQSSVFGRVVGSRAGLAGVPIDIAPGAGLGPPQQARTDAVGRWSRFFPMDWPGGWVDITAKSHGGEETTKRVEVPRVRQVRVAEFLFLGEE